MLRGMQDQEAENPGPYLESKPRSHFTTTPAKSKERQQLRVNTLLQVTTIRYDLHSLTDKNLTFT